MGVHDGERTMNRRNWTMRFALSTAVLAAVGAFDLSARADDKSAALYKQKCAACHGADGKGDTPAGKNTKVRSFGDPEVAKQSDDELAAAIEKGKNKMPAYGKSLKPDEIKAMVAYIRSLTK
jgi:mono/diheme cytochrome c family protein